MPQITQATLDSINKKLDDASTKLKEQAKTIKELESANKDDRVGITKEIITDILVSESDKIFSVATEKLSDTLDKTFSKHTKDLADTKIEVSGIDSKVLKEISNASDKGTDKVIQASDKLGKESQAVINKGLKEIADSNASLKGAVDKLAKEVKETKAPVITVQPQDIKFPEQKDIIFPVQPTLYRIGKDLVEVSRDTPLPVILTDDKGGFYKAMMTAIGGGGGGIQRISTAVVHGTNPTSISSGDTGLLLTNTAGVPFVIGGHPNIQTIRANYAAAQTDTAIVTIATGLKIVVTRISITASNENTVNVSAVAGFGLVNTPATTGVLIAHPGIAAGSGVVEGTGAGMLGVGADGEDLRITSSAPTTGSIDVVVSYYTINS